MLMLIMLWIGYNTMMKMIIRKKNQTQEMMKNESSFFWRTKSQKTMITDSFFTENHHPHLFFFQSIISSCFCSTLFLILILLPSPDHHELIHRFLSDFLPSSPSFSSSWSLSHSFIFLSFKFYWSFVSVICSQWSLLCLENPKDHINVDDDEKRRWGWRF